jgi:hypothetical protein
MRGLLCSEFLGFTLNRFDAPLEAAAGRACEGTTCPGPAHLHVLAGELARECGVPPALLLQIFGEALLPRLARGYPAFFVGVESTLDLIDRFDVLVTAEIGKLDGSARPPTLTLRRRLTGPTEVVYRSPHGLGDLVEGLLRGSIAHFRDPLEVKRGTGQGRESVTFALQPCAREAPSRSTVAAPHSASSELLPCAPDQSSPAAPRWRTANSSSGDSTRRFRP